MTSYGFWAACSAICLMAVGCSPPPQAEKMAPPLAIETPPASDEAPVSGQAAGAQPAAVTLDLPDLRTDDLGRVVIGEGEIGVPFYPGSTTVAGGASRLDTVERKVLNVTLESYDPPAKVAEFYEKELTGATVRKLGVQAAEVHVVRGSNRDGAEVKVSITRQGRNPTVIQIKADIPKEAAPDPPAEGKSPEQG